jgi:hypothetical protein
VTTGHVHQRKQRRSVAGYSLVLALIGVSYVLCASQVTENPTSIALLVQLVTVAVILQVAQVAPRLRRTGWTVLAIGGAAATISLLMGAEGHLLDVLLSGASALAYLVAPVAVIAHQLRRRRVDAETLVAAVASYVLVGMFFTFVYNCVSLATLVPTFANGTDTPLADQLFFSFTTLTTTGYGNLVPTSAPGQTVAIIEAITGQLFLVIAVSRVVAGWEGPRHP